MNAAELEALDARWLPLVREAAKASEYAYAPYSNFRVGAALLLEDGCVFTGSNQENASYPLCLCAERVALARAHQEGPAKPIAIAVIGRRADEAPTPPTMPCGACRQVLHEFVARTQGNPNDIIVIASGGAMDDFTVSTLAELLPKAFGPNNL